MTTSYNERLGQLVLNVQDPSAKIELKNILDLIGKSKVSEYAAKQLVNECLKPYSQDKVVKSFLLREDNISKLNDLGVRKALRKVKASKIYESISDFREKIDNVSEAVQSQPEFMIVETVVAAIKSQAWNQEFKSTIANIMDAVDRIKPYKCVAETIQYLREDKNAYIYNDLITKLEYSLGLPAAQVYEYLKASLQEFTDINESVKVLLQNLSMMNPRGLSSITNIVDYLGKTKIQEGLYVKKDGFIGIAGKTYKINEGKLELAKFADKNFQKIVECLDNCEIEGNRLTCSDGTRIFNFDLESDGVKIWIDGEKQEGDIETICNELAFMGCDSETIEDVKCIYQCGSEMVQKADDGSVAITACEDVGLQIHIIICEGKTNVVMVNKNTRVNEFVSDISKKVACKIVKESFNIDISEKLGISKEPNKVLAKIKTEQVAVLESIGDIDSSIKDIEEEEEIVQSDPAIQTMLSKLKSQKDDLTARYNKLCGMEESFEEDGDMAQDADDVVPMSSRLRKVAEAENADDVVESICQYLSSLGYNAVTDRIKPMLFDMSVDDDGMIVKDETITSIAEILGVTEDELVYDFQDVVGMPPVEEPDATNENIVSDYEQYVENNGHMTEMSSSVIQQFIIDNQKSFSKQDVISLAKKYGFSNEETNSIFTPEVQSSLK